MFEQCQVTTRNIIFVDPTPRSFHFNEISIVPQKNICKSRLDVDIKSEVIRGISLDVPLIAANMSTVCNSDFCIEMYKNGALGVMHRAASKNDILGEISKIAKKCDIVAASVGIDDCKPFGFIQNMVLAGANIIFADAANGYSDPLIELGRRIKEEFPHVKVVIGNTTDHFILPEIADFADALKVGIAQGSVCETKNTAGVGEGQFSAVLKFKEMAKELELPIISDGGIREPADFVKALAAGANSVMAGRIFARCPESAAETVIVDGVAKKLLAGMASRYVQDTWKGQLKKGTCPEGKVSYLDIGESVKDLIERYSGALRSGITYCNAKNIKKFQENVRFVQVTPND
jgi:IMP dehydrogenase